MKTTNKFNSYPNNIRPKMDKLRQLILKTAKELEIKDLEETLKWDEPSYLTKHGSTIRIDWKASTPNQYAMYFHCQTKLVETFREIYQDTFQYQDNRAIVFELDTDIPEQPLKHCISLALKYHKIKNLPLLGA